MVEMWGGTKLVLIVTVSARSRESTGVDVLVACDAVLLEPEERLASRKIRKPWKGKWDVATLHVTGIALKLVMLPLESKGNVWVSESLGVVIAPGQFADEREVPAEVLTMAARALGCVSLQKEAVKSLPRAQGIGNFLVTIETPNGDTSVGMA